MREIRFSHFYDKFNYYYESFLSPPQYAILLEVFVVDTEKLHQRFIEYDTLYYENGRPKYYRLPKGKVLVLLFQTDEDLLFTTIRRFTPKKYDYYMKNRGEMFKIVINKREK